MCPPKLQENPTRVSATFWSLQRGRWLQSFWAVRWVTLDEFQRWDFWQSLDCQSLKSGKEKYGSREFCGWSPSVVHHDLRLMFATCPSEKGKKKANSVIINPTRWVRNFALQLSCFYALWWRKVSKSVKCQNVWHKILCGISKYTFRLLLTSEWLTGAAMRTFTGTLN